MNQVIGRTKLFCLQENTFRLGGGMNSKDPTFQRTGNEKAEIAEFTTTTCKTRGGMTATLKECGYIEVVAPHGNHGYRVTLKVVKAHWGTGYKIVR